MFIIENILRYNRLTLREEIFMFFKFFIPMLLILNAHANDAQKISNLCRENHLPYTSTTEILKNNRHINLEVADEEQMTPLLWCTLQGNHRVVELLLQHGANSNAVNNNKRSALIFAAKNGYTKIVKSLLATGALRNLKDIDGYSAADWANRAGYYKIVIMIGERPDNIIPFNKADVRESYLLIKRVVTKKVSLGFFKEHWKYGALIDEPVNKGRTILIIAAQNGRMDLLNTVLNMGAKPDIASKRGITALMAAAGSGHLKAAEALINRGADPNLKDKNGKTALDYATGDANLVLIDFIDAKMVKNYRTKRTVVNYLKTYKRPGKMALLVKKHMKVLQQDGQQKAREKNALKAIESKNSQGLSDISYPGRKKGGNKKSPYMSWAAFNAIWNNDFGQFKKLINLGLSLDVRDAKGNALLTHASSKGYMAIVDLLITRGAKVNPKNDFGNTPLMIAAQYNKVPVVFYLLENGANKKIRNKKGWVAARFAQQARNKRTFNALRF